MNKKILPKVIFNFDHIELPPGSPEVMAVNLARIFYKQMRKQNFDEKQIIQVATELIGCLNNSLKGLQNKVTEHEDITHSKIDNTKKAG